VHSAHQVATGPFPTTVHQKGGNWAFPTVHPRVPWSCWAHPMSFIPLEFRSDERCIMSPGAIKPTKSLIERLTGTY
jgi:hypothetical protein